MNTSYVMSTFQANSNEKIDMKFHISITYPHTLKINELIKDDYWGNDCTKLYYYIDYTFRARYYDNKINLYKFNNGSIIGIYCLNLYKKDDVFNKDPLYLVFRPNPNGKPTRRWCVHTDSDKIDEYCLTSQEICQIYGIRGNHLPKFGEYVCKKMVHKYVKNFDWNAVLKKALNRKSGGNTRKTLSNELKKNGIIIDKFNLRQELADPFEAAFEAGIKNDKKHRNCVASGLYFSNSGYELSALIKYYI